MAEDLAAGVEVVSEEAARRGGGEAFKDPPHPVLSPMGRGSPESLQVPSPQRGEGGG